MTRVVASIEARMGASRLPGKVLADINGAPALSRMLRRLRQCLELDDIVVATTDDTRDDPIEAWAATESVACYRGSEDDVLRRVVEAHRFMGSDIVVELCGDCPVSDPRVIDLGIHTFATMECDIVSTTYQQSFPPGIDVQVFRLSDLVPVADSATDPAVREHVSLYFYEHPEQYRLLNLHAPRDLQRPELRLLLDYPEDLELLRRLYTELEPKHGDGFQTRDIVDLYDSNPEFRSINAHRQDKPAR